MHSCDENVYDLLAHLIIERVKEEHLISLSTYDAQYPMFTTMYGNHCILSNYSDKVNAYPL